MPSLHSKFGASSAARLLACPGSFHAGVGARASGMDTRSGKPSDYADEGTAAHLLAEMCLASGKHPLDYVGTEITLGHRPDKPFVVTPDFAEDLGVYVESIETLTQLGCHVTLEQTVEPAWAWTGDRDNSQDPDLPFDLFGTADCVAYQASTETLYVCDLKFGRGVVVEAQGNVQLRYYAVGALAKLKPNQNVSQVILRVVQPRAHHKLGPIRQEWITPEELLEWARGTLKPGIDRALQPDQPFVSGEHCRFCPAILTCPQARSAALETARAAFAGTALGVDLDALMALGQVPDPKRLHDKTLTELDELYRHAELTRQSLAALEAALKDRLAEATVDQINQLKYVKPVRTAPRYVWSDTLTALGMRDVIAAIDRAPAGSMVVLPGSVSADDLVPVPNDLPARGNAVTPSQARKIFSRAGASFAPMEQHVQRIPGQLSLAPKQDSRPIYAPGDPAANTDLVD